MILVGSASHARLKDLGSEAIEARNAAESMPFLVRYTQTSWLFRMLRLPRFLYRGYSRYQGGDLAAQIAYHALIAIVPIFFLLIGVGGLFLRNDEVMTAATRVLRQVFPSTDYIDAFKAALEVRQNSTIVSLLSFIGFAWAGTGLISSMARAMNKLYGVRNASYIVEKQRGFVVILLFLFLFIAAILSSIVPTMLLVLKLPYEIERILQTSGFSAFIGYSVALASTLALFYVIYRVVPNARQTFVDVWPGTIIASVLFMSMAQVFPFYIQLVGGVNRYGRLLGLISLIVAALYFLAHIILLGCFINVTWRRDRMRRARMKRIQEAQEEDGKVTEDKLIDDDLGYE